MTNLQVWRLRTGVLQSEGSGFAANARLADGSSVQLEMGAADMRSADLRTLHVYAAIVGFILLVAVSLAVRSVAAPLTELANTVSKIDLEGDAPPLSTSGPREVRLLAAALNSMLLRTREAYLQRTLALAALSHDLMSPLARLRFRAGELDPSEGDPIQRDVSEMETMVSDVLAYLRAGHDSETLKPVSVDSIVRTVADEFAEAGAEVREGRIDSDTVLEVRRVALKRAITNLIGNAIRHGRNPWVDVFSNEHEVRIRVGDEGPGIAAEDLPKVTNPFFRGDRARRSGGGSGLGLSTVKAIVEAHGGALEIESTPGRGTLATLVFPKRPMKRGLSAAPSRHPAA